jgi:hypothetical protein
MAGFARLAAQYQVLAIIILKYGSSHWSPRRVIVVRVGGHEEIHKATQALAVLLWRVRLAFGGHARERARRTVL